MDTQRRTTRRPPESTQESAEKRDREALEATSAGGTPAEELLPRVRSWGNVAREALRDCERGAEAVKRIRLRRNRSGQ